MSLKSVKVNLVCLLFFLSSNQLFADYKSKLNGLSTEHRAWVEKTCHTAKDWGPSSYIDCVNKETDALIKDQFPEPIPKQETLVKDSFPSPAAIKSPSVSNQQEFNIDYVIVNLKLVNLRETPDISSNVLTKVSAGSILALLDRKYVNDNWLHVLDIDSNVEGWIHKTAVDIHLEKQVSNKNIFESEALPYESEPEIAVENKSNKNIRLKVGKDVITVSPNSKQTLNISSGSYKYYASAPGVIPAIGTTSFERSHRYTWTFWIVKK